MKRVRSYENMSNRENKFSRQFSFPIIVFTSIWLALWGWMRLIKWIYRGDTSPNNILRPYMGVAPEANAWLEVWQRWDVLHYQAIAERGYTAFDTALFTPPLYPVLMRFVSIFLNGNTLLSGLIISILFCAMSFVAFQQMAQFELKDEKLARQSIIYFVLFPTSFFLFAPYTESLFMLGSILCLLSLQKKNWLVAGLSGMLAAASRLTGAVLLVPVFWFAWEDWKQNHNWKVWLSPLLVLIAASSFPVYTWLGLGKSILAPFEAQSQRFHGGFTFPGLNILKAMQQVFIGNYMSVNLSDIIFTLVFIWLGILVWKQLPRIYGIYYLSFMILYLTRIAETYPLLSMTRYVLALFPAFLILPRYGQNPIIHRIIIYIFIFGLLFFSAQFAIWGWVG